MTTFPSRCDTAGEVSEVKICDVTLRDGMQRTVDWYKLHREQEALFPTSTTGASAPS